MPHPLPSNTVHLWMGYVDRLRQHQQTFTALLSDDERQRAERFIRDSVRQTFISARGMLRTVLADYLAQPAQAITFTYGKRGKPSLSASDIHFNLSHSGNVIMLGVINGRDIGVDVEHIHPQPNMALVAHDNFSAKEFTALFELPDDQRLPAFYNCWTRKEAYIKAVGDGFALPLQDFDVTLKPDDPPRFLRIKDDDPARWSLAHIDAIDDYIGALCVSGTLPDVHVKQFDR